MNDPNPFDFQRVGPDGIRRIQEVREACKTAYEVLIANVKPSAERTLAVRRLEEASMWANKSIAFEETRQAAATHVLKTDA